MARKTTKKYDKLSDKCKKIIFKIDQQNYKLKLKISNVKV